MVFFYELPQGDSILFTHFNDLERMKGSVNLGATQHGFERRTPGLGTQCLNYQATAQCQICFAWYIYQRGDGYFFLLQGQVLLIDCFSILTKKRFYKLQEAIVCFKFCYTHYRRSHENIVFLLTYFLARETILFCTQLYFIKKLNIQLFLARSHLNGVWVSTNW